MSYDVWLETTDDDGETVLLAGVLEIDSDRPALWCLAFEGSEFDSLGDLDDRTAAECLPVLRHAISEFENDPGLYVPLGADVDTYCALQDMVIYCELYPQSTVKARKV